ncbi:uncharacterized protein V1518DRAFT_408283 [Limtongia smithiae]|uniref:uncharacterized protein n=1 Tax=Limtongia smithiae TaxID=1125753 RepID=UPI0034CE911F
MASRFTAGNLAALAASAPAPTAARRAHSPLRVVAHVDLDAFYAQCECVRLGLSPDTPVACQQWQSLIAVNYAARAFGISRHENISDARKKCPHLVLAHVATWKEGEAHWAYHDGEPDVASHKVSLDPYRIESAKIFRMLRATCAWVEYAGIDEAFLDLSALVHDAVCEHFPHIAAFINNDPPGDTLLPLPGPLPPDVSFTGTLFPIDPNAAELDTADPSPDAATTTTTTPADWDDVVLMLASHIVADLRARVLSELKYTCSAGIATNRVLAKLCSAYKKPNNQTILRTAAVPAFLAGTSLRKLRGLGGKLGSAVAKRFGGVDDKNDEDEDAPDNDTAEPPLQTTTTKSATPSLMIPQLLLVPLPQLIAELGHDTGTWLYNVIRGVDDSEVKLVPASKSMLSAKNFRPPLRSSEQAQKWLRIFVADISSRLRDAAAEARDTGVTMKYPATLVLHHRKLGTSGGFHSKQMPIPLGATATSNLDTLEEVLFSAAKTLYALTEKEAGMAAMYPCANLSLSVTGFAAAMAGMKPINGYFAPTKQVDVEVDEADDEEDDNEVITCEDCGRAVKTEEKREHDDWHYALALEQQLRAEEQTTASIATSAASSTSSAKRKDPGTSVRAKSKAPKLEKGQRRLF